MNDVYYESIKDTNGKLYAEIQNEYFGRDHFHRAYEIAYIFDGNSRYIIDGENIWADTDNIVFAHCYYRHRSLDTNRCRKYVIAIPENLSRDVSSLLKNTTLPALMPDKEFNKLLLPYFKALTETNSDTSEIILKGYINLIFGFLAKHYESRSISPKSKDVSIMIDILNYIDMHIEERLSLEDIAKNFGYNKSYFSRFFNKYVGISLSDYINFARLNRFEYLSRECPDKSITELVYKSGFQSLATFYRTRSARNQNKNTKFS